MILMRLLAVLVVLLLSSFVASAQEENGSLGAETEKTTAELQESAETEDEKGLLQDAIESMLGTEFSRVRISGLLQVGFTFNPDSPGDHQNFSRISDDRTNEPMLNQILLTVEQALDPGEDEWDWGFRIQLMYGSDARFLHSVGIFENLQNDLLQFDVAEATLALHMPLLLPNGIDITAGLLPTLCGYETVDSTENPLYSHSYIYNAAVPIKHMGGLVNFHLCDNFDLILGGTFGSNTGFFDDNNDAGAFHGGFAANFFDGDLTIDFSVSYGPENPDELNGPGIDADRDARTIFGVVIVAEPCDGLTLITDAAYGFDDAHIGLDGETPEWYGFAQYAIIPLCDTVDFVLRGEIFRDDDGYVVAQFGEHDDFLDLQRGDFSHIDARTVGGGDTTYYAFTLGLNWRPYDALTVQLETRWDFADDNEPFDDSTDDDSFTAALSAKWRF